MRDGWREVELGEIADFQIGKTPPRKQAQYWTTDTSLPFCSIADMEGSLVDPQREGITQQAIDDKKAKRVPAGSLLMSFKLTIGRVGFAARDLFPNEAIVWIKPKSDAEVDLKFLSISLAVTDFDGLTGRAVKGKTLNQESMARIPVLLPPLAEQRRIADFLVHLDEVIACGRWVETNLTEARASLLTNLLSIPSSGITPRKRVKLGELISITSGNAFNSHYFNEDSEGVPLVRIRDLTTQDPDTFYSGQFEDRFLLSGGEFLVGMDGDFTIQEWSGGRALLNQRVCKVETTSTSLENRFLRYLLEPALKGIQERTTKTTVKHLSVNDIRNITTYLPSIARQRTVVELLDSIGGVLARQKAFNDGAERTRAASLRPLLSGEHEIPEYYDRFLEEAA